MDSQRFDQITSSLSDVQSRRGAIRLFGAVAASVVGVSLLTVNDADAGRRKRKGKGKGKGKGGERCLKSGQRCETDNQCCGNNQICEVPQNASNSDTECCGATGATCGGVNDDGDFLEPYCCIGEAGQRSYVCSESDPDNPFVRGTCQPAPDEI